MLLGKTDLSVKLLKKAIELYPNNINTLNNLVYRMAHNEEYYDEINRYIPLLMSYTNNPAIADTIVFSLIKLKQYQLASDIIKTILPSMDDNCRYKPRMLLMNAELSF